MGDTNQAISGMLELNQKIGVLGGPTSGLIYNASLKKLKEIDSKLSEKDKLNAVFIVCDRMEPYMSYLKKYTPELFSTQTTSRPTVATVDESLIISESVISSHELQRKLKSQNPPIVIDIRGNFAYSIEHIPTSINILNELFAQIIEQGKALSKDKEIVVICSFGKISPKYAIFLQNQGYKAYSLEGGFGDWKKSEFDLEKTI